MVEQIKDWLDRLQKWGWGAETLYVPVEVFEEELKHAVDKWGKGSAWVQALKVHRTEEHLRRQWEGGGQERKEQERPHQHSRALRRL